MSEIEHAVRVEEVHHACPELPAPPSLEIQSKDIIRTYDTPSSKMTLYGQASDCHTPHSPFLTLPYEVLLHVIHYLDAPPPSQLNFDSVPSPTLHTSPTTPLKSLCLTAPRLHKLLLPLLFRHTVLDPTNISSFLIWVRQRSLTTSIESVTVIQSTSLTHVHPPWWTPLLHTIPSIRTLTICCPPHVATDFVGGTVSINNTDAWAFHMPWQLLRLSYDPKSVPAPTTKVDNEAYGTLFGAKPWTEFGYNEGSHLHSYTTYEYFLRRPPSLLGSLLPDPRRHAGQPPHTTLPPPPSTPPLTPCLSTFLNTLRSFTYIAIFPFYNHVDVVLGLNRLMTSLEQLRVSLAPGVDSGYSLEREVRVINGEAEERSIVGFSTGSNEGGTGGGVRGRIDMHDPWNEFETGWNLVAHTVIALSVGGQTSDVGRTYDAVGRTVDGAGRTSDAGRTGDAGGPTGGKLQRLECRDWMVRGVREGLEQSLGRRLGSWWDMNRDNGVWTRRIDEGPQSS